VSSRPKAGPLSNVRVLVGRARHQASALSSGLRELGAEVIEIPFIEIQGLRSYKLLDAALRRIADYDWLILTSVNGVDALAARMQDMGIAPASLKHLNIAAIGPATRKAIEKLGLKVAVVPQRYVAESIVEALRDKVKEKRVLLARAKVARDVIPRELRKAGAEVHVVEAYETIVPASSRKRLKALLADPERRPQVITFTSSSSVRNFVKLFGGRGRPPHTSPSHSLLDETKFASIGPVTSATLRKFRLPVHIEATEYTIPGLIWAIVAAEGPSNAGTD